MTLSSGDRLLPLMAQDGVPVVEKFTSPESTGDRFVLAKTTDGTVIPVKVSRLDTDGDRGFPALLHDGVVSLVKLEEIIYAIYNFGTNASGELANGTTTAHYDPQGLNLENVSEVAIFQQYVLFLMNDGKVYKCGDGTTTPVEMTDISFAKKIATRNGYLYFVDASGSVKKVYYSDPTTHIAVTGVSNPDKFITSDDIFAQSGTSTYRILLQSGTGVVPTIDTGVSNVVEIAGGLLFLDAAGDVYVSERTIGHGNGAALETIAYFYGYDDVSLGSYPSGYPPHYGYLYDPWKVEIYSGISSIGGSSDYSFRLIDGNNHIISVDRGMFPNCLKSNIIAKSLWSIRPDSGIEVYRMANGSIVRNLNSIGLSGLEPTRDVTSAKDIIHSNNNVYMVTSGAVAITPKLYAYWGAYYDIDTSTTIMSYGGSGYEETYPDWTLIKYHKIISKPQRFTGTGLDDLSFLRYKSANFDHDIRIKISSVDYGDPLRDRYQFSVDGGSTWSAEADITSSDITISSGDTEVVLKFNSTTGHTVGDYWRLPEKPSTPSVPTTQYWHWSAAYDCWDESWVIELTHTDASGPVTGWSALAEKGLSTCTTATSATPAPPSAVTCYYYWFAYYDCGMDLWEIYGEPGGFYPPEAYINDACVNAEMDWTLVEDGLPGCVPEQSDAVKITTTPTKPGDPTSLPTCYYEWDAYYNCDTAEWEIFLLFADTAGGPVTDWTCDSGCEFCGRVTDNPSTPAPPSCTPDCP